LAYFNTPASGDLRGGVATDPAGNIYVMDTEDAAVRTINARSGIITLVAGLGTACSAKTDNNGDNCPLANTKFSSTPRGIASDPYGNILVAGNGSNLVNLICNAVSPLCPNTSGTHQVGSMYLVAGCVANTGTAGTAGPGAATGANGGTATPTGTCNTSVAELDAPRGVAADRYGNVYIADTTDLRYRVVVGPATYNGVANPLATLIAMNPTFSAVTAATAAGNIYPLLGGFTSPASGAACVTGSSTNSLDAFGDGCPYYVASLNSPGSSAVQAIAVDPNGNILLNDLSTQRLRVIYIGGMQMANVITLNNPTVATPLVGSIYSIAGGGTTGPTSAPQLGKSVTIDTSGFKITNDSLGNIYIGDNTFVLFYDINTGYIRRLAPSGATFGGSNGLGIALNGLGDLFLADSTNLLIRKVAASSLIPTAMNSSSTQSILLHGIAGTTKIAASLANTAANDPISIGAVSCSSVHAADGTLDCTVPVTFAPLSPGTHTATLAAVPTVSPGVSTTALLPLTGTAVGTALVFDGSGATATTLGNALEPTRLATDGNGNLFTYDVATSTVTEVTTAGTVTHLSGALPGTPTQIALDASGNVYAVGGGAITEFALGSNGAYTAGSVSFTPNGAAATPQAIAIDTYGNLFIYDGTSKTIYRQSVSTAGALTSAIASGFDNVVSLALDNRGNLFVSDAGTKSIYSINAAGTQTTLATNVSAVGLSVDAAGDLYVADALTGSIFEFPVSGPKTTLGVSLTTAAGVAVDPTGNVYAADTSQAGLLSIPRGVTSVSFGTSTTITRTGTITNAGNVAASGVAQTDSTDITFAPGAGAGCIVSATSTSFTSGNACTVQATFTPNGITSGTPVTDTVTFLSGATTIGSINYAGTVPINPTTTTITSETPAIPLFAATGTEVTFTVTVTNVLSGSAVSVTVDSGAATSYPLNSSGMATISLSGLASGSHTLSASYAGSTNADPSSVLVNFTINQFVATGDSRTVTEPAFPAVCTALSAALTSVNDDIPTSVDASITNPDGARIQAALNSCATNNPGHAVELSVDGAGHNAYLTGPLSMPSNVTLLVDPGVVVYFSRNVQDYDVVPGTHTCGTVNSSSATSSCLPLIDIKNATDVSIMGFGKLDGRGGDTLINAFPSTFAGQSWWGLSTIANSGGSQQNPRFIQIDAGSSNITLYKITIRNSPLFHVSTTGATSNLTAWDIKIVTPTSSRNTDGIDPGNVQNVTITRSWISDGDDNVAVGAANTTSATNISVTNNHFFAGHGESIGSFTQAGVNNVLFDGNMSSGNGTAGVGSSVNNTADSNSTGIRIKSGYDRGGVVSNIQYSNSCFQNHKAEIDFNPNFENTTGSATPNFKNILMQNLTFLTEGTVQFTGTSNNGTVFPLQVTLDNVSFATLQASDFGTIAAGTAPTNALLTYGPGQVSGNFVTSYATFVGANGNTVVNQITESSMVPPACNFTYIAPELTGPAGTPQTIIEGQNATAVVILTPTVGGKAYPTGTVTLTDALTTSSTTVALPGSGDTIFIPLTNLAVGTHTFTASYSGDANYVPSVSGSPYTTTTPYVITVNAGSLASTTTTLSGVPSMTPFGTSFTAVAAVAGSNPTGTVQFIVNGSAYATETLNSGTASAVINLPFSASAYNIDAIYSGDPVNDGSISPAFSVTVTPASTATTLSASTTTTTLGHPVLLTATVSSPAGAPTGTVSFSYTTATNGTPVSIGPAVALSNGSAAASAELPQGTNNITATYNGDAGFAASTSVPMSVTINFPTIIGSSTSPIALPYTMTTIAGGATASNANTACAGSTDSFGDGCQGTAIAFTAADDMRSVAVDPFGNIYLTDKSAKLIRRIAPNGVITNFAGKVSGTTCVPTSTTGCTPTLVSLSTPRGVSSDGQGNIYVADFGGNKVYKVSVSTGLMFLVAGTGTAGATTNGSVATSTNVNAPRGVWADTVGNIYIADTSANQILVVDPTGFIHIFAGTGTAASNGDGGPATSAAINNPQGVMTDVNLNVYIADSSGGKIRVVCVTCGTGSPLDELLTKLGITSPTNGFIYTIAGSGIQGNYSGPLPTLGTNVSMTPEKLTLDNSGNIYISDSNNAIWFVDFHTGYIRAIARNSTVCANATDSFGDGCPATQASFGSAGGNGIGVGTDALGNVYISDSTNLLIRKVTTDLASSSTATGSTVTQPVQLHFITGDGPASTNPVAFSSTEWALGASTCTVNTDSTTDCMFNSSFTPAVPGARSTPLNVSSSLGNTANLALTGAGLGAGSTLDPAAQVSFGANLKVAGLATDPAGNVYVSDAISKQLLRFTPSAIAQGVSATPTSLATLTAPGAVAVDPRGFVYVADTSTGLITQVSPSSATSTLALTLTAPAGLAVDSLNNLYVSDSSTQTIYQYNPINGSSRALAVGTMVAPAGLAIDPNGNLLITDPGAAAIYRFNLQSGVTTAVSSSAVRPSSIAADAAGNLLIADTASILAVPASANSASFRVANLAPSALAIDSAGDLYTGSSGSVLELMRTQGHAQFAGVSASPQAINLLESGNQALQLSSVSQSDTVDYSLSATASTDCTLNGILPSALLVGGACVLTATYTPTTFATTTDTAIFNGNLANASLSTPPSVQLVLTGPSTLPTATIVLNAISPASPVFDKTVTVSATVSGPSLTPAGTVAFTVDGSTTTASLTVGVATTTLTGLSVGTHTISATYTSSNGFSSATTPTTTFAVGRATATVTLSNLSQTYTGSPLSATTTTTPTGLAVSVTYSGSPTAPTVAGSYAVIATINNPNFAGSASGTLTIAKAATTITFSANPTSLTRGQSDLLSATVTGAGQLGGTVIFSSGDTTLCTTTLNTSGIGSCSFVPSTDGNLPVTAQYSGDGNHLASSSNLMLFVFDGADRLQLASTHLVYPGATNVTVCISPATSATATGTVQIFDGTTLLTTLSVQGGGCAYWYISPGLSAGTHQLTAVYSGDRSNPSGTSVPVTITVSPVPVTLSASCWNASFAYGANYQCTVNVSSNVGAALGSITYTYDGGLAVNVPLSNGSAQFTLTKPNVGAHTVVVAYAQQTNYAAGTSQTETFTVAAAPVIVSLTPSSWFAKAGTSLTFQSAVSSWSAGAPNDNGTISFYDGTTLLSTVPINASGQASFTTSSLAAGGHTITATYAGGTNYASGSDGVTITLTQ
jgi:sugar lactone lactonase YvrE